MNKKFSDGACRAVNTAFYESASAGASYVGSEHLLIALALSEGKAGKLLVSLGMDAESLRGGLRERGAPFELDTAERDITPKLKKLLLKAVAFSPDKSCADCVCLLKALLSEECAAKRLVDSFYGAARLYQEAEKLTSEEEPMPKTQKSTRYPTPLLDKNGSDLTEKARKGELDPVIGRECEEERVIRILLRRTKNNPCLIGEPGVGKTAVAESVALRIVRGQVPTALKDKRVIALDVPALVAGTKYRGEFEDKLRGIIEETVSAGDIILFADEIHTIVGAGAAEGAIDASNILKPYLARGEIQLMGATTLKEYKKFIEKDGALERRFQSVLLEEPDKNACIKIMKGIRGKYELFHGVIISDGALDAAVELSSRYIGERCLPDKAIDLMDEAAARCRIENQNGKRVPTVERCHVENVLESSTGIKIRSISPLAAEDIKSRIHGQEKAVETVVSALRRYESGLRAEDAPPFSMLFYGGADVGKTALAKEAARLLFGSEKSFVSFDLAEYEGVYGINRLLGTTGGEGGILTEKVRRRPRCLLYLQNVQSADAAVCGAIGRILEEGELTDGNGLNVSFRGCVVVLSAVSEGAAAVGFAAGERELPPLRGLEAKVDELVPFSVCRGESYRAVAKDCFCKLQARMTELGVSLEASREFVDDFSAYWEGRGLSPNGLKKRLISRTEHLISAEAQALKNLEVTLFWENCEEKIKISAKNC